MGSTPAWRTISLYESRVFVTLVFLFLTVFLLIKLNSVIGTRIGHQTSDDEKTAINAVFSVVNLDKNISDCESVDEKITLLMAIMPNFSDSDFKRKSKMVFEIVFNAYAQGRADEIEGLVTQSMYKAFDLAIKDRNKNQHVVDGKIESLNTPEISDIKIIEDKVSIYVKFVSEQTNITKDAFGNIIEGDPNFVDNISETWVFEKKLKDKGNKWLLAEIIPE